MNQKGRILIATEWFCQLTWMWLLYWSIVNFETRIYTDSAYYLFQVINHSTFHIELNRYILAFSQWLPLLLVKLNLPLKLVLIGASAGHVLFHYGLFSIIYYTLHQKRIAVGLLCLQFLGISSAYFTPMFELYYSTSLVFLFAALQNKYPVNWFLFLPYALLLFITLTGHPMTLILLPAILAWNALQLKKFQPASWVSMGLMIGITIWFKSWNTNAYELGKSEAFKHTLNTAVFNLDYLKQLGIFLYTYYADWLLVMLCFTSYVLLQKKWLSLIYWLSCLGLLLFIANISHYGFEHTRYQEQVYFPLMAVTAFAATTGITIHDQPKYIATFVLVVLVSCALRLHIYIPEYQRFAKRIERMHTLIGLTQLTPYAKWYIYPESGTTPNGIETNWSYSLESLFISSMQGNTVTICTTDDWNFEQNKQVKPNQFIARRWDVMSNEALNAHYFSLPIQPYRLLHVR